VPLAVDVRVSFSREAVTEGVEGGDSGCQDSAPTIHERLKKRRTFEATQWRIQLTRVSAERREVYEVEVELRMDEVRSRMTVAVDATQEALSITRELVAALRTLAGWASEVACTRKRKRLEDFRGVEPDVRSVTQEPEVAAELRRFFDQGSNALHGAKIYLHDLLKARYRALDEGTLFHIAGQQVGKALRLQKAQAHAAKAPGGGPAVGESQGQAEDARTGALQNQAEPETTAVTLQDGQGGAACVQSSGAAPADRQSSQGVVHQPD